MMNKISKLIPELEGSTTEYLSAVNRKYNEYIQYAELPDVYKNLLLDRDSIPPKAQNIFNNLYESVNEGYNLLFNFNDYKTAGSYAAIMIDEYFRQCEIKRSVTKNVLYVDTNLLLQDYKRLIDYNPNTDSYVPVHSLATLYRNIECAPMVFWNRFTKIDSNYDRSKMYDILLIRYRKGLGNFFFIAGGRNALYDIVGKDIADLMDIFFTIDCSNPDYKINFKDNI